MKHNYMTIALAVSIIRLFDYSIIASAAVPVPWTVDMRRAQPATFEAYQGETLDFKASLTLDGKPFEAPSNYSFFWQTNGMGRYYWEAPCIPPSTSTSNLNLMVATWLPEYDCGARVYNCFIGRPSNNYHTAFQLRLRPSPGATPNVLPLPVPVIDFAKVRVLNPPWSGGGGGGVDTNAVRDIVREQLATNGIRSVDGAARPLPKYLHLYNADDSYPEAAQEYYRSRGNVKTDGGCSSVRDGVFLYRNFDYPFDDRAEFVVKMSAGTVPAASSPRGVDEHRYASVGVAQVGTNLTEQMVTSGKPEYSHLYKWLPGATVDGINENGVACNINVVDGDPQTSGWHNDTGDLNPLAAIRWILDHATNAQHAAEYIASHIAFPQGWTQNFHYMICDAEGTYIVENGEAVPYGNTFVVMTNHGMFNPPGPGPGIERAVVLRDGANITNVWYTNAYRRETNPPWVSDLADVIEYTNEIFNAWATHPKEYFRGKTNNGIPWWQTVHTSVYDLSNRVLRVSVQETDDWYTFQVPSSGAKIDAYTKAETDEKLEEKISNGAENAAIGTLLVDTIYGSQGTTMSDDFTIGDPDSPIHALSAKADRAEEGDDGELATLDEDGNPTRSGIAADDVATWDGMTYGTHDAFFSSVSTGSSIYIKDSEFGIDENDDNRLVDSAGRRYAGLADLPEISATDPTFSNAVDRIVRSLMPTTLRAYDPVRQCWWKIQPVNGVLTLTVED